ncbi:glycosyl hydrolase family 28 protein [Anaerorudis cellulosivorans]|uniref:glycosyl hydrolase family 28 protein n=1 Tax=Anaerorudis cellulosivorans TaxID=3397862 RepID=UPI00221EE363|nr:glycosyl hydrolase family 28 protein [Seramator thermalis]MCW1735473.1 glycosyl hydrolase family 28 protein [Seramator thermalis]
MKSNSIFFFFTFFVFLLLPFSVVNSQETVYPKIEGLSSSDLYSVNVNGYSVWTEKFVSNLDLNNLPDWFSDPAVRQPQELHMANFTGKGKLTVKITVKEAPRQIKIRPANLKIEPVINGKQIYFSWEGPGQLVVEMEGKPPLFLFANPEDESIPSTGDPHVKYFGPGIHRAGYIEMKDNETVYIAPGAVVYGGIRAKGASNIRVIGRGILDGNYEYEQMVKIEDSQHILFEGITVRNGKSWTNTLINCRDVEYNFVKVMGFGPSSDGINPAGSQRVRITHCFIRCTDDCIAIKAPNYKHPVKDIYVDNNIMLGFAYADGITIGFETNAEYVQNVEVHDCDILLARGGSRVDGHSGFSIICDGPAIISHILFDHIRVEKAEIKLFELHITDGTLYGEDPPGHIRDVVVKNVEWLHEGPIVIWGLDEDHRVENVIFKNCTVAGQPLGKMQEKLFKVNEFTENIIVE